MQVFHGRRYNESQGQGAPVSLLESNNDTAVAICMNCPMSLVQLSSQQILLAEVWAK